VVDIKSTSKRWILVLDGAMGIIQSKRVFFGRMTPYLEGLEYVE